MEAVQQGLLLAMTQIDRTYKSFGRHHEFLEQTSFCRPWIPERKLRNVFITYYICQLKWMWRKRIVWTAEEENVTWKDQDLM